MEICTDNLNVMPLHEVGDLVQRLGHLDTEFFCLVGSGDRTAVIRRQDDDRAAFEFRIKYPLA